MEGSDGQHHHGTKRLVSSGTSVLVCFTDIRDSFRAKEHFYAMHKDHLVDFIEPCGDPKAR